MSDDLAAANDDKARWPLWLILAGPLALALGLYLGFYYSRDRTISFWIELVLGAAMVVAGIFMLMDAEFPEGKIRRRTSVVGFMVLGVAFMSPRGTIRMTLIGVVFLWYLLAFLEIPKRLFRPRPS